MIENIYVKAHLNKKFYDTDTSDFLFRIIKEGCNRRIAICVVPPEFIECGSGECILSIADSFNFQLANPLTGADFDAEVQEYRPQPLLDRLMNLQGLFQFILEENIVKEIEVFFTENYDIEGLETVHTSLENFALKFESRILNDRRRGSPDSDCRIVWSKEISMR